MWLRTELPAHPLRPCARTGFAGYGGITHPCPFPPSRTQTRRILARPAHALAATSWTHQTNRHQIETKYSHLTHTLLSILARLRLT